jgi:hypothetical protein
MPMKQQTMAADSQSGFEELRKLTQREELIASKTPLARDLSQAAGGGLRGIWLAPFHQQ